MTLNYIWIGFFVVGFVVCIVRTCLGYFGGGTPEDAQVFAAVGAGTMESAKNAFTVILGLTGTLTLWMGIMRVGEKAGAVNFLSKLIGPFFKLLFPSVPAGHAVHGQIMLNYSANMLGLSNAATPMGLKAMQSLQELNPDKDRASDPMIMFLALNTAGFALIPVSILALRTQLGAANPTDVFVPILIASFCATLAAIFIVSIRQRIMNMKLLAWLALAIALMTALISAFLSMSPHERTVVSGLAGNILIMGIIVSFLIAAAVQKINAFSEFIEGAKEGFQTMIRIVPYIVGLIVAIGVLRNSGALAYIVDGFEWVVVSLGGDPQFVPSIPVGLMKPLSGSGTETMAIDVMNAHGVDSFAGRLASIMYASADTTFYIIAVYFGAISVRNTRYAVTAGLLTDLAGILAAIFVAYLFFG